MSYNDVLRCYFGEWLDITNGLKKIVKNRKINISKPIYTKELDELILMGERLRNEYRIYKNKKF